VTEYRTRSGAVLTEADLDRLADEAERGYCTELVTRDSVVARCFKPMPCAEHPASWLADEDSWWQRVERE